MKRRYPTPKTPPDKDAVQLPERRRIELYLPSPPPPPFSMLDRLEKLAKILGILAIPVFVGFGGKYLDESSRERESKREYLKIAVDILSQPTQATTGDADLRAWAAQILTEYSPVPLPRTVIPKLSTGASDISTSYQYDPNGNLTSNYTYDTLGRQGLRMGVIENGSDDFSAEAG